MRYGKGSRRSLNALCNSRLQRTNIIIIIKYSNKNNRFLFQRLLILLFLPFTPLKTRRNPLQPLESISLRSTFIPTLRRQHSFPFTPRTETRIILPFASTRRIIIQFRIRRERRSLVMSPISLRLHPLRLFSTRFNS